MKVNLKAIPLQDMEYGVTQIMMLFMLVNTKKVKWMVFF